MKQYYQSLQHVQNSQKQTYILGCFCNTSYSLICMKIVGHKKRQKSFTYPKTDIVL